jgi:hypothetical protein
MEAIMPRRSKASVEAATGTLLAYRYSPGDRHTYTWDGVSPYATVYRHKVAGLRITMEATGDLIDMEGCARTGTAFLARVDEWRSQP